MTKTERLHLILKMINKEIYILEWQKNEVFKQLSVIKRKRKHQKMEVYYE